jgi:hypothetical protein
MTDMKLHGPLLALLMMTSVSACATVPAFTPYQAAVPGKFGFSEERIEATRFRIVFEGNSRTTRQRVEDSLLLRASAVTLENGYDWFQIVNRATDPKTYRVRTPGIATSWGVGFGYHGGFAGYRSWSPRFGWVHYRDPFAFGGFDDVQDVTRFQANAEIVLGKGAKPIDRADAFDARDVSANLTPRLATPMTSSATTPPGKPPA